MNSGYVTANGVNPATGGYYLSVAAEEIARAAQEGSPWTVQTRGLKAGVEPRDLAATGWGAVFHRDTPAAVRDALGGLLRHRREQADYRYRELVYQPGDDGEAFLLRHGHGPGPVDPGELPYYLLLVGGPEEIPLSFQYQLDIQYAAGRIAFETPEEYERYAGSVVAAERRRPAKTRKVVLFSTQHPDDEVTRMTADHLMRPLAGGLQVRREDWEIETFFRGAATKDQLGALLGGSETPDLLFTACHGLAYTSGDPRQLRQQGALLCQGWPGPKAGHGKPIPEEIFFSGEDLSSAAHVQGMICFLLACFSAGTPRLGSAVQLRAGAEPTAPRDFLAGLPRRLLSHPNGGALAVIAHIDTVWECSLLWEGTASQVTSFESTLWSLMRGYPVGEAMKYFRERCGEIASWVVDRGSRKKAEGLWLAFQDARGYVVLGDPAVRLPA